MIADDPLSRNKNWPQQGGVLPIEVIIGCFFNNLTEGCRTQDRLPVSYSASNRFSSSELPPFGQSTTVVRPIAASYASDGHIYVYFQLLNLDSDLVGLTYPLERALSIQWV